MRRFGGGRSWWGKVVPLALAVLLGVSASALASHNFSDVPDALGLFHSAVEWLVNRGITGGCAPGLYCPFDPVTRTQMALFMQRLGRIFTDDRGVGISGGFVLLDPDAGPRVCITAPYTTTTFPEWAFGSARVSLLANGLMNTQLAVDYSTDGGMTWINIVTGGAEAIAGASSPGIWYWMRQGFSLAMNTGTNYRFSVRVLRVSGTADASDFRCSVGITAANRNLTTSPLRFQMNWR